MELGMENPILFSESQLSQRRVAVDKDPYYTHYYSDSSDIAPDPALVWRLRGSGRPIATGVWTRPACLGLHLPPPASCLAVRFACDGPVGIVMVRLTTVY